METMAEPITLDKIEEKLHKAEVRRTSFRQSNSPPFEERREKVLERRASLEKASAEHLQKKVEEELALAEQKRIANLNEISHKLKEHNSKVEEVRNHKIAQDEKEKELLKEQIEMKLDNAEKKRDAQLEHVKSVAQLSASKKHRDNNNEHDNIVLPAHSNEIQIWREVILH